MYTSFSNLNTLMLFETWSRFRRWALVVGHCWLIVGNVLHRFGRCRWVVVWVADDVLYRLTDGGIAHCMLLRGEAVAVGSGLGFGWGTSALARWMILGLPGWFL